MEYLCPLCNGLNDYKINCSNCSGIMKDGGRIQDYYDDYSPYLSHELTDIMDDESDSVCQHIFTCPICGHDKMVDIKKIFI